MFEIRNTAAADGSWRPLSPGEEAAYRAEQAYRDIVDGEARVGATYRAWCVADEVLHEVVGHEGYAASVAWAEQHYGEVRRAEQMTIAERVATSAQDMAAARREAQVQSPRG